MQAISATNNNFLQTFSLKFFSFSFFFYFSSLIKNIEYDRYINIWETIHLNFGFFSDCKPPALNKIQTKWQCKCCFTSKRQKKLSIFFLTIIRSEIVIIFIVFVRLRYIIVCSCVCFNHHEYDLSRFSSLEKKNNLDICFFLSFLFFPNY